jgi:hypothetical protein
LRKYLELGGNILIFPPQSEQIDALNTCLRSLNGPSFSPAVNAELKVNFLDRQHPLFGRLFEKYNDNQNWPSVSRYFPLTRNGSALMKLQNGDVFLSGQSVGKGQLLTCATALDDRFGNFQKNAYFVVVAIQASMLKTYDLSLYHFAGDREFIALENQLPNNARYYLSNGSFELAPEIITRNNRSEMNTNGEVQIPGHYHLGDKGKNDIIESIAFNIQRRESDTRSLDQDQFDKLSKTLNAQVYAQAKDSFSAALNSLHRGTPYWKWCILLVLFFLFIEILLIRFLKN